MHNAGLGSNTNLNGISTWRNNNELRFSGGVWTREVASDPTDITFDNVDIYCVKKAVTIEHGFEGATFLGCTIVLCDYGIEDRRGGASSAQVGDPLITVSSCHINTMSYGIICENRFQSSIINSLIYGFQGYAGWKGLVLHNTAGTATNIAITGNTFFSFATGSTGIEILATPSPGGITPSAPNTDTITIGHNCFDAYIAGSVSMSVGISLGTNVDRVIIADTNTFSNVTTPISGVSSSNKIEHSIFNQGSGVITMLGSGTSENKLTLSEFNMPFSLYPSADNARANGRADRRWSTVYGVNGDFSGTLSATTSISTPGFLVVGGTIGVTGNLSATSASFSSAVTFNGAAGFNGGFNVTAGAAFASNVTVGGTLAVTSSLSCAALTATSGTFSGVVYPDAGIILGASQGLYVNNGAGGTDCMIRSDGSQNLILGEAAPALFFATNLLPTTNGTLQFGQGTNRILQSFVTIAENVSSDARLKNEVETPLELLVEIKKIKLKSYTLKDGDGRINCGVFAQDIINAFDNAEVDWRLWNVVNEDEEGMLSVVYDHFFALKMMAMDI